MSALLSTILSQIHDQLPRRREGLEALRALSSDAQAALVAELFSADGIEALLAVTNASPRPTKASARRIGRWMDKQAARMPAAHVAPVVGVRYWAEPSPRVRLPLRFCADGLTQEVYVSASVGPGELPWFTPPPEDNPADTPAEVGVWSHGPPGLRGMWSATWGIRLFWGHVTPDGAVSLSVFGVLGNKIRQTRYERVG